MSMTATVHPMSCRRSELARDYDGGTPVAVAIAGKPAPTMIDRARGMAE
ncbi:MAG: hypothetical protein Q8Q28_02140 [Pseudomonadota bacterium]|nr:hypothetical protein [Pseudomonadota bacterium]